LIPTTSIAGQGQYTGASRFVGAAVVRELLVEVESRDEP
jgi:hypothetical protein